MKAVILVGGEGTRLRPLTYSTVKAMMPVLNKPFIWHFIHHLQSHDINNIILAMGYRPDSLRNYFDKEKPDAAITFSIEPDKMGTAGALKFAQPYIDMERNETIFVFNGDVFSDMNLTEMLEFHNKNKALVTIALTRVEDPSQFGVVELTPQKRIIRFIEKPKREDAPTNLINAGAYIINSEILNLIPANKHFMFERDVFPQLVAEGKPVFGYVSDSYWIDMGTPEKYLSLNNDILTGKFKMKGFIPDSQYLDPSTKVDSSAQLTGAIIIDKNCIIGKGVQLKGPLSIGASCQINENSVLEKSILWNDIKVGNNSVISESIIASDNIIMPGSAIKKHTMGVPSSSNPL
jgi:mannose-1-phosphate guanylyltransferase